MSELIKKNDNRATIRWKLLTGVSALALVASASAALAKNNADQPLIWVELGGSVDLINGTGDIFKPDFTTVTPVPKAYLPQTPLDAQRAPRFTFGPEGKLTFQPSGSDWVLSAAIRYGRSNGHRDFEQQTSGIVFKNFAGHYVHDPVHNFLEATTDQRESHTILDFQAGKDFGLGTGSSDIDFGVRFAQFTTHSGAKMHARPDLHLYAPFTRFPAKYEPQFHEYTLLASSVRTFHGVGPSLSWNASTPLAGNVRDGEISLDWGINGALLFGRQRANVSHSTYDRYLKPFKYSHVTQNGETTHYNVVYHHTGAPGVRSRNVTVPDLGATIGLTYRVEDFKLNFSYRADYFFGALDGGIDRAKKTTLSFNGLYASVSIGLGD